MKTKIYYSVENGGDGSAYPRWMESEELAEIDQEFMDEGWGESCTGWLTIEHDTPIKILDHVETVDSMIAEIEEQYEDCGKDYFIEFPEEGERLKGKLDALKKLKNKQDSKKLKGAK